MTVPTSARWSAYALAAVLAWAAAAWVGDDQTSAVVQPSPRNASLAAAPGAGETRPDALSLGLALPTARRAQGPTADPFAVPVAAADDGPAGIATRALPTVPAAPSAPPLPFVYLGSWKERGKTLIFVQRDDRSYKIDGPGPLDAEYAVRSVDDNRITLNYLPLGIVQELRLDAPAGTHAVAAAPAQKSSPEPDPGEN